MACQVVASWDMVLAAKYRSLARATLRRRWQEQQISKAWSSVMETQSSCGHRRRTPRRRLSAVSQLQAIWPSDLRDQIIGCLQGVSSRSRPGRLQLCSCPGSNKLFWHTRRVGESGNDCTHNRKSEIWQRSLHGHADGCATAHTAHLRSGSGQTLYLQWPRICQQPCDIGCKLRLKRIRENKIGRARTN